MLYLKFIISSNFISGTDEQASKYVVVLGAHELQ